MSTSRIEYLHTIPGSNSIPLLCSCTYVPGIYMYVEGIRGAADDYNNTALFHTYLTIPGIFLFHISISPAPAETPGRVCMHPSPTAGSISRKLVLLILLLCGTVRPILSALTTARVSHFFVVEDPALLGLERQLIHSFLSPPFTSQLETPTRGASLSAVCSEAQQLLIAVLFVLFVLCDL